MSISRSQRLSAMVEFLDGADAAARRLCSAQPDQAGVRRTLLALEKKVDVELGWDRGTLAFQIMRARTSGEVALRPSLGLTELIARETARGLETGEVVDDLADAFEHVRARIDGGEAADGGPAGRVGLSIADYVGPLDIDSTVARGDLAGTAEHRFHGIGLLFEGWLALGIGEQEGREVAELGERRMIAQHPDKMELRQVLFSARDGYLWQVWRLRHAPGMSVSRFCMVTAPEDDRHVSGGITESLTRICNAIANNPVPVIEYDTRL